MIFRSFLVLSIVLVGAIVLPGCGSGEGGVCQVPGDCAAGLLCTCQLGGAASNGRGICHAVAPLSCTNTIDANIPDANLPDAWTSPDAWSDIDMGPVDDAGMDGGPDDANVDTGSIDADTDTGPDDVGTDAG